MRKTISILSAFAISIGTCLPAGLAFATPPDVGEQSGAGSTDMTMVWQNADQEYGGIDEPKVLPAPGGEGTGTHDENGDPQESGDYVLNPAYNPNRGDGYGENLAFSTPTSINYVAKASGELLAPNPSEIRIENHSSFGIHVSSLKIDEEPGWNIVENKAAATETNSVWGNIGPAGDALNWSSYKTAKTNVTKPSSWNMSAYGAAENADKLFLSATDAGVANVNVSLAETTRFATVHWYLKAGNKVFIPSSLSSASLSDLTELSANLRAGNVLPEDLSELVGQTTISTLGDSTTATIRLVDASASKGLVFQFDINAALMYSKMENAASNAGGWTNSVARQNLNSDEDATSLYAVKLRDMQIDGETISPVPVTLSNLSRSDGITQVATTSGDLFWLPSVVEIFGQDAWATLNLGYSGDEGCTQFAYYAALFKDDPSHSALAASRSRWLRSVYPNSGTHFMYIYTNGAIAGSTGTNSNCVAPCFCL